MTFRPSCLAFLALALTACRAPVGVSGTSVPKDGAQQCSDVCQQMGTTLADIVVMANNVGCVCEPPRHAAQGSAEQQHDANRLTARFTASAAGGLAAELMAEEAQRQQQQQQQTQTYRH